MSADFDRLLPTLVRGGVEFILIGGVAGIVHGSARATYDVDVVYARDGANLRRLAETLKEDQIGRGRKFPARLVVGRHAGLETRDTADLEVCAAGLVAEFR